MMEDAYTQAGVDIEAGEQAVAKIADITSQKVDDQVLAGVGGFGSLFEIPKGYQEPVMVASSDGVGTKLLIAIAAENCRTIGQDLVAMCANDIVAQGADPLFFLDYLGIHHVDPDQVAAVVQSIQDACTTSQMSLIGGETAEMADMYAPGHYDLAGFAVGIVEKSRRLRPEQVAVGDVLLGLPSSGLHANGFSLVRQILFKDHYFDLDAQIPDLSAPLGTTLLTPTRLYQPLMQPLLQQRLVKTAAHITGGGIVENLPRCLPATVSAEISWGSWPIPPIFPWLQSLGQLSMRDMLRTFNLGIGMILVVKPADVATIVTQLAASDQPVYQLGTVVPRQPQSVLFAGSEPFK